jgi:hypothetical protein
MKSVNYQGVNMNGKTGLATIFLAVSCLLTSGCFNVEQEIFLEPDESGDMVIFISVPDIPEDLMKGLPGLQEQKLFDENKLIEEIKLSFEQQLPPGLKLKDAREVRRHGARAFYIVVHFNNLKDINSMLGKFSKLSNESAQTLQALSNVPLDDWGWKIQMEKSGDLRVVTQSFYVDLIGLMGAMKSEKSENGKAPGDSSTPIESPASISPNSTPEPTSNGTKSRRDSKANSAAPKKADPFKGDGDPFKGSAPMGVLKDEKTMSLILSSILKMRFVLHSPRKITDTNADIVLNGNIAIWNVSPGAFVKEKKPINMKATF